MSFLKQLVLFFLLLSVITLVVFFYQGKPLAGVDDANIFMNYSKHLARGEGFVFNTGGERIEGFTSFLWVLICTLFYFISAHPELLMMFFLLILTSVAVTLVYREVFADLLLISEKFARRYFFPAYCIFLICIGPFFMAWSVLSLMENGLWNFLFVSLIILILRFYRTGQLSVKYTICFLVLGILLLLTRPEGLAWSLVFLLLLIVSAWKSRSGYLVPALFFLVMAGTVAALTFFRVKYFGYPLPNTWYAKVSHDKLYNLGEGLKYLVSFITNFHPVLTFLLVVLILTSIRFLRKRNILQLLNSNAGNDSVRIRILIITFIIFIALALPLTTGGDHFGSFRFYQGSLLLFSWGIPSLFILFSDNYREQPATGIKQIALAASVSFLLLTVGALYNLRNIPKTRMIFEFDLATEGRKLAKVLNGFWPQNKPSVGMIAVGGFSLRYEGTTIDLMGLNNILMGHSKGDRIGIKNHAAFNKDVFYQLHSDLVLPKQVANEKEAESFYAQLLSPDHFDNQAMKNIFQDDAFRSRYFPAILSANGNMIFAFVSNNAMDSLQQGGISLRKIGF